MSNKVFANGREVACKAGSGKSIAAFPDVCMTPPENPATPPGVPIPYPNTAMAGDTTDGTKKVKISKKEVMLKNKSSLKKSSGNEAGAAAKKGVVTSKNVGKAYFNAWSMDVKFEGENVVRHLDLTTHNHGSVPGNTPTWPYIDSAANAAGGGNPCADDIQKEQEACGPVKEKIGASGVAKGSYNKALREAYCSDANKECRDSRKCSLQPYEPEKKEGQAGCCKGKTGHHVIAAHCFMPPGERAAKGPKRYKGCEKYDVGKAPCICVTGKDKSAGDHKKLHDIFDKAEDNRLVDGKAGTWSYQAASNTGAKSVSTVTGCDEECIKSQVDAYHRQGRDKKNGPHIANKTKIRADSCGTRTPQDFSPGSAGGL